MALIQSIRPQGDGTWKESVLRPLLELVEPAGQTRDGFGVALAALLSDIDPTNLVGVPGIPGHRGFFSEFGDRFANHLLPSPRDERDLRRLSGERWHRVGQAGVAASRDFWDFGDVCAESVRELRLLTLQRGTCL